MSSRVNVARILRVGYLRIAGPFYLPKIVLDFELNLRYKDLMELTFIGEERYDLDLEGDDWALYRQATGDPSAYLIRESRDINEIFIAMFRDKASRGRGSTVRIG